MDAAAATAEAHEVGRCWECGYALRGLPVNRCPECGRAFDPADESTMNMGAHVGGLAARLMRPPGWPLYVLTAVAVLVSVWAAAAPVPSGQIALTLQTVWEQAEDTSWGKVLASYESVFVRYAYAVLAWVVVALIWVVRRTARGVTVRRVAGLPAATLAYWRRWLIPNVALLATVLFCLTPGPVYVGFWASYRSIENAQRDPDPQQVWTPPQMMRREIRWVGVYPVPRQGGIFSRSGGAPDQLQVSWLGGFVYSPDGPPDGFSGFEVRYVGGGWYSYHRADVYR